MKKSDWFSKAIIVMVIFYFGVIFGYAWRIWQGF